MNFFCRLLVSVLITGSLAVPPSPNPLPQADTFLYDHFPADFTWTTATASYQIEGAWNVGGRAPSIWDTLAHQQPPVVHNGDTGDIACDSYNNWREDVEILKDLGVKSYRFSIAWPRVLPTGKLDQVNEEGIEYYNNLIDALVENGIDPMVTLYHWDLPQTLQDEYGGWLGDEVVDDFVNYAQLCFTRFGNRVTSWITFNEPWIVAWFGYGEGNFAPRHRDTAEGGYIATHNIIRAHTKTYRMYESEFKEDQKGKVGITLNAAWGEPLNPWNPADQEAATRGLRFSMGWYANPLFIDGDYPEIMKTRVAELSTQQGYSRSRLPEFTPEEIQSNLGASDFLGLNLYTSFLVFPQEFPIDVVRYDHDDGVGVTVDPTWLGSGSDWLKVTPWGLRRMLNWMKEECGNPEVIVTENGISDRNSSLDDDFRIFYYKTYINEMLKAIVLDGCNVSGYAAWSLLDNFEWLQGYSEKFGLVNVDFNDPARKRTKKKSFFYYKSLIAENGFKPTCEMRDFHGARLCQPYGTSQEECERSHCCVFNLGLSMQFCLYPQEW